MTNAKLAKIQDAANGKAFRLFNKARTEKMACKRVPMLLEAAAQYRTSGDPKLADRVLALARITNNLDFHNALGA